jgi:hypothetical protein
VRDSRIEVDVLGSCLLDEAFRRSRPTAVVRSVEPKKAQRQDNPN